MRKNLLKSLLISGFLIFSLSSFGQVNDKNNEAKKIKPVQKTKINSISTEIKKTNEDTIQTISVGTPRKQLTSQERIQALKNHIEAIDIKVDYVKSDKKLKRNANEKRWFEEMQVIRKELAFELSVLQKEQTQ